MDQYSIESNMVLPFVQSGVRLEDQTVSYLQEGNLREEINRMRDIEVTPIHIDIMFCRILDHYFTHGHDRSLIEILEDVIGCGAINSFLTRNCDLEMWKILKNGAIYGDKDDWNDVVGNKDMPTIADNTLKHYYHSWVNKDAADCDIRFLDHNGMSNAELDTLVKNNIAANLNRFYAMFPAVSFALSYLTKFCCGAEVIKKIALDVPYNSPDSVGNDLWLRRRALVCCSNVWGPRFTVDHLNGLSSCLLDYTMLRANFNARDLRRIKMAILVAEEDDDLHDDDPDFSDKIV